MFGKYNEKGKLIRNRVTIDCQKAIEEGKDIIRTEQNHKDEVNINNIIRRHGIDLIQQVATMQAPAMQWDDVTGNDFQEAMFKVTKAQQTFDQLPSDIRKKFDNNPAVFLDYVQNPDNVDSMIDMGLAIRKPEQPTVNVKVTNESISTKPMETNPPANTTGGKEKS